MPGYHVRDTEIILQQYKYQARHVMPPVWGSKSRFRPALEPCKTGVWFRLARPFLFEIQKNISEIFGVFFNPWMRFHKSDLARNSSWVSLQPCSVFRLRLPLESALEGPYAGAERFQIDHQHMVNCYAVELEGSKRSASDPL